MDDNDPTSVASGFARRDAEFAGWPVGTPEAWGADVARQLQEARAEIERLRAMLHTPLTPAELRIVDRHLGDWIAFRHAWNAIMKGRLAGADCAGREPAMKDWICSQCGLWHSEHESGMRERLREIEAEIAAAGHWGAKLTALDEERRGILRALRHG